MAHNPAQGVYFYDYHAPEHELRNALIRGLQSPRKYLALPFNHSDGARARFAQMLLGSEYYLPHSELSLLRQHLPMLAAELPHGAVLFELGINNPAMLAELCSALQPGVYVPVDGRRDALYEAALAARQLWPGIEIHATCQDFCNIRQLPSQVSSHLKRIGFYSGAGLESMPPQRLQQLFDNTRSLLGADGVLLLGMDLSKDAAELRQIYQDAAGHFADLNYQQLRDTNLQLEAGFVAERFIYGLVVEAEANCLHMGLFSTMDQMFQVAGHSISLRHKEWLNTGSLYQYRPDELLELARSAGFMPRHFWSDPEQRYGLFVLE